MNTFDLLASTKLVAIARLEVPEAALPVARALLAGGIKIVEFTLTNRGALRQIEETVSAMGSSVAVGAGTVLDPESARQAIFSGAQFVVTPSLNVAVIQLCRRYSVPVIAGALTPTEIVTAWQAGADLVKLFPASAFGSRYLREMRAPFPQVKFLPTGGIGADNLGQFLLEGAVGVGVGGSLVTPSAVAQGRFEQITEQAERLVNAVADVQRKGGADQ